MGCFTKPRGLWVSVDGEHGWEEWCRAENFSHMGTFKYRVDLIPGANILVLTSPEELDTFDAKYGVEETYPPLSGLNIPGYTFRRIDWLKVRRKYDGIIIAPYIWERRLSHLEWYYTWDCASGCIWRRGYLLEGPPGTGKSSFVFAVAGKLNKAIYIINASTIRDDNTLQRAMNIASNGIVVMEDIDAINISKVRQKDAEPVKTDMEGYGITLSGLLNAIDGVGASDGRILFLTSNQPDKLDSALLRPGRIDMRSHFGYLEIDEASAMFRAFEPAGDLAAFREFITPHLPISAASLQGYLLGMELEGN